MNSIDISKINEFLELEKAEWPDGGEVVTKLMLKATTEADLYFFTPFAKLSTKPGQDQTTVSRLDKK